MKTSLLLALASLLTFMSCRKNHDADFSNIGIEIYLLKTYSKESNSSKILNETVVPDDTALIKDAEIYSYNPNNYTFTVSAKKTSWLNDFQTNKTHGRAFAVTVNREIIYTGYFWASFSSASVDWITIDPININGKNTLTVRLGYPGTFPGMNIPDLRNDLRILEYLKSTKRLY